MTTINTENTARWWLTAILIVLMHSFASAQSLELKFDHLSSENGLPQNGIFGIAKDKYGFMWFGTWSGLCRYDGYHFKVYRNQLKNPRTLINSRVMNLLKDSAQNLWIQTANDSVICRYNYETDDFDRIPARKLSADFLKKLDWVRHKDNISFTYHLYRWQVDSKTDLLTQTFIPSGSKKQYRSSQVNRWSLNDSFVTDIYLDEQHIFWVGTYSDGINTANLDAKPFHSFSHLPDNLNSITDNHVRAIGGDHAGNLWIGTRADGISIVSPQKKYRHLKYDPGNAGSIRNNHVKKIFCDSRDYVWIGMLKGLDVMDPATGRIRHYAGQGVENAAVFGAMEDHQHRIWFATWSGIYQYFPKTDVMQHYNADRLMKNFKAMTIIEDHFNRIWIGTEGGGVSVFKADNNKLRLLERFTNGHKLNKSLSDDKIYSIYEDAEHFIWIGTGNGVDRYDPVRRSFKHFGASPEGLTSTTIAAITEDHNGFIWVSHKKGISQIDKKSFAIRNYSIKDGLNSNEFTDGAVYNDRTTGMLYFGGNNGYVSFHPDSIKTDHSLPRIVLTELQVLNKPVNVNDTVNGRILLSKPLYLTKSIELNFKDRSIAIEFAGLHYANPSGNKYAYMLAGFDKGWIYTNASARIATYSNLPRGNYVFKVKASNSDGIWNQSPATLSILVLPPWWESTTAYCAYVLLAALILYLFYYYSLRYDRLKTKLNYESILHEKDMELHQSKINFFTNISHEIKTPLSLILAPIERLMTINRDSLLITGQLTAMKENGDRLLRLINQLLDIRRFETGNDRLLMEEEDMADFVKKVAASFMELARDQNIQLHVDKPEGQLIMKFDRDKLEKVLYNLLSNAFKYTDAGGSINIDLQEDCSASDRLLLIKVSNNGTLIPQEDFQRIFQPFQQASNSRSGGTGLGLSYAKALVDLHHGNISVVSRKLEDGSNYTCFTVSLPFESSSPTLEMKSYVNDGRGNAVMMQSPELLQDIALGNAEGDQKVLLQNEMMSSEHHAEPDRKLPVLLLVEDNFDLRSYLMNYFMNDYQVIAAQNGEEGFAAANEHNPEIILTDMTMPVMDGLALCIKLKSSLMTSHIPVILLTARSAVESQIAGMESGADDYITKPFNLQLLSLKVKNLLATRARMQEKYKTKLVIEPAADVPLSPDEKLLKKVLAFVDVKIDDPALSIDDICTNIGLSKAQLYRKMKALTGFNTVELIKQIRLRRAQDLLTDKKFNVNEVAYLVGFTDPDYFRKCFKAEFGVSPSEFVKTQVTPAV